MHFETFLRSDVGPQCLAKTNHDGGVRAVSMMHPHWSFILSKLVSCDFFPVQDVHFQGMNIYKPTASEEMGLKM